MGREHEKYGGALFEALNKSPSVKRERNTPCTVSYLNLAVEQVYHLILMQQSTTNDTNLQKSVQIYTSQSDKFLVLQLKLINSVDAAVTAGCGGQRSIRFGLFHRMILFI